MSDYTSTPMSNRYEILADVWMNYRDEGDFKDFVDYNDLGLPLSYALSSDIVKTTPTADQLVNETWELFLEALGVDDNGWDNLDQLLAAVE